VPAGDPSLDAVAKKTLSEVQFVVGDWVDVAVYPEGHGGVSSARGFGGGRGGVLGGPRENGFGGFKVRGGARGGFADRVGGGGVPSGEWRRGERVEDSFERDRGIGRGAGGSFGARRGGGGGGRRSFRD